MIGIPHPPYCRERQFRCAALVGLRLVSRLRFLFHALGLLLVDPLQDFCVVSAIRGLEIGPSGPEMSDRGCIAGPDRLSSVGRGCPLEQLPERAAKSLGEAMAA